MKDNADSADRNPLKKDSKIDKDGREDGATFYEVEVPEFSPPNSKSSANSRAQTFGQAARVSQGMSNTVQNVHVEEMPDPPRRKKKSNKTVRWAAQEHLEEVKYFKMNDEPNKAGLSLAEVQEI